MIPDPAVALAAHERLSALPRRAMLTQVKGLRK